MKSLKVIFVLFVAVAWATAQTTDEDTTQPPPRTTPGGGSSTSPGFQICEEGDTPMLPPECPPEDPEGLPTYFPYPYDCTKYFQCTSEGVARCIQCPNGTVWDQELTICNHELVVPCVIITTVPTTPTTPTTTTTSTTTTTTTPPPITTTPTTPEPTTTPTTPEPTTTTTDPPTSDDPINWICPEDYFGKIGHPYDCRYFYNCAPPRRPCLFLCPNDLYYNPETTDCDWPYNVPSCQGGSPPPPTGTPRTTYRNIKRFYNKKSIFSSVFSLFEQETSTNNPCEQPWAYHH